MHKHSSNLNGMRVNNTLDPQLELLASRTIGAAIEVHRVLGPGYVEAVYEEALCIELESSKIQFQRQHQIDLHYKNRHIGQGRIDLLVESRLIVELKAADGLSPVHTAQVISYLKLARLNLGLLINFNVELLKDGVRRVIL